ncbi:dihydrodipicolinate synthase family protein [Oceanivirga miroungae]|uniref:Dihydrodipicolinate synthase n=1 Tax=Oceanivirga miroungae TaxID=1130046 RepID=A0A6I8M6V6_9FUSO|nr:dihydrodipicolinate synthase family protein [Oceanivirga miroungae]VWL85125.1 dihydrodipicolinate synthase [Oceanivirga miroungae]
MKYDLEKFKGVFVALYSAYDEEGNVCSERAKKLTQYYLDKGVKGLYVGGSSGEGVLQSEEERKKMLEAVMSVAKGKMTIIAHIGANSTPESVRLAKHAEEMGVDAISSIPCVYYGFSPRAVKRHWDAMIDATDLPFIIYHIPQTTRFNLPISLFTEMAQNEKVIGIKCSSESTYELERFKFVGDKVKGHDFIVFNGPDEQFVAGRIIGADSGIGGTYGVMPELFMKLNDLMDQERIKVARKLQDEVNDIIADLLSGPNLYGVAKYILHLRGVETGNPRGPMLPVETDEDKKLCERINKKIEEVIEKYKDK